MKRLAWLLSVALLTCCATASKIGTAESTEAVENHVYALPADTVLTTTENVLVKNGFRVDRQGNQLGTDWRPEASGSLAGYRVVVDPIDADHCTVHVEMVAATGLGSGGGGRGGDSALDPELYNTLNEPPPGLVAMPRGRDDAFEWALLRALDPKAAKAIAAGEQREGTGGTDGGTPTPLASGAGTPLPGAAAATSASSCGPAVPGADALSNGRRLVLLAAVPGTKEIPAFVAQLACQAATPGVPTVVALPLLRADQDWVDTYLSSAGKPADRTAFLHGARSFAPGSTAGSTAVLDLLDKLRTLRDAGLPLGVVAFDEPATTPSREKARASGIEQLRRADLESLFVVVVGQESARTKLRPGEAPDQAPLGWYLARWGLAPVALALHTPGGQHWACGSATQCGPAPVTAPAPGPGQPIPSLVVSSSPDAEGFQGSYAVGPLTASPPPTL